MYEHNALGYWSGLALCLTKVRSSRARCPATALISKSMHNQEVPNQLGGNMPLCYWINMKNFLMSLFLHYRQNLEKLRQAIDEGRKNAVTKKNKAIITANETLNKLSSELNKKMSQVSPGPL